MMQPSFNTMRSKQSMQSQFCYLSAKLIIFAFDSGFELTYGEAYRPSETAKLYADKGIGTANSLHGERLAIDLNLFLRGEWISGESTHWEALGRYWESLSPECRWGGRFKKRDYNHFSFTPDGKRA